MIIKKKIIEKKTDPSKVVSAWLNTTKRRPTPKQKDLKLSHQIKPKVKTKRIVSFVRLKLVT